MYAKSRSMDYPSFFHPSISAAKDRAPDLLGLEEEEEEEEDNLYAELWQQILQLTLDEDGNPVGLTNQGSCPVVAPSPVSCSDSRMNNRNVKPLPVWQLSLPRRGSGTGVFIPSITKKGVCQGTKASKKKKKKKAKKQVENK